MRIGLQLYTLRDFTTTKSGFLNTLDKVAAIGYAGVEVAAVGCMEGDRPEVSPGEAAAWIKERGLAVTGTHTDWESFAAGVEREIAFQKALGSSFAAVPVPPEGVHDRGPSAYREWLVPAKAAADRLRAEGITLAYHNHAMEFQRFGSAGERPYDVLVNEAPWLAMELDTFWVHHSGNEVVPTIRRLGGRLPCVHLKDVAPFGWEVTFAPVGEGNLNWPEIFGALREAGTDWVIVEQDSCRRDPFDSIKSSLEFVKTQVS